MPDYLPIHKQLNILLEHVTHEDGSRVKMQEISDATGISPATLSLLKNGKQENPQLSTLRALCAFFDMPLHYFETTSEEECLAIIANPHAEAPTPEMSEIAFRAVKLTPQSRRNLLTLIKWVEASEREYLQNGQLPPLLEDDTNG